ncbi:MAG TPA: hypothetical protein VGA98_02030 [Allosphingosinicella sp.]|jgi:hypothetical protein
MIFALLLAAQALPTTPLPPAMEPAINLYSECVFGRVAAATENVRRRRLDRRANMASAKAALRACAVTREKAMMQAEAALAAEPGFAEPERRRSFIQQRFAGLDVLVLETANGRLDPDNWK